MAPAGIRASPFLLLDQDPAGLANDHATSIVAGAGRPLPCLFYFHVGVVNFIAGIRILYDDFGHSESINS